MINVGDFESDWEEVDQIIDEYIEFKKLKNIELSQECHEKANEIFDLF